MNLQVVTVLDDLTNALHNVDSRYLEYAKAVNKNQGLDEKNIFQELLRKEWYHQWRSIMGRNNQYEANKVTWQDILLPPDMGLFFELMIGKSLLIYSEVHPSLKSSEDIVKAVERCQNKLQADISKNALSTALIFILDMDLRRQFTINSIWLDDISLMLKEEYYDRIQIVGRLHNPFRFKIRDFEEQYRKRFNDDNFFLNS